MLANAWINITHQRLLVDSIGKGERSLVYQSAQKGANDRRGDIFPAVQTIVVVEDLLSEIRNELLYRTGTSE